MLNPNLRERHIIITNTWSEVWEITVEEIIQPQKDVKNRIAPSENIRLRTRC